MKIAITTIATIALFATTMSSFAYAQEVPDWVKSNAGWWADGTISESEFLSGVEFLVKDGIIVVPQTATGVSDTVTSEESVPDWVKSNAGWWADGTISDGEFVNGIQYLIKTGLISISTDTAVTESSADLDSNDPMMSDESDVASLNSSGSEDPELAALQAELEKCSEITKAYKRIDCEKPVKAAITLHSYKSGAEKFELGPISYYWFGLGSEGNEFEISPTGQPILSIRMLAENTSSEITALNCTSPAICSYDVWDGSKSFKYSGMDFTSGQIVLNPGDAKEFNILFGPNIGYGGTEFEYDSSKTYHFRINEGFGSTSIELDLES